MSARFFDRPSVDRMFAPGWRRLGTEERLVDRYAQPKMAWEVVGEKPA